MFNILHVHLIIYPLMGSQYVNIVIIIRGKIESGLMCIGMVRRIFLLKNFTNKLNRLRRGLRINPCGTPYPVWVLSLLRVQV